jgi:hypothetical protein
MCSTTMTSEHSHPDESLWVGHRGIPAPAHNNLNVISHHSQAWRLLAMRGWRAGMRAVPWHGHWTGRRSVVPRRCARARDPGRTACVVTRKARSGERHIAIFGGGEQAWFAEPLGVEVPARRGGAIQVPIAVGSQTACSLADRGQGHPPDSLPSGYPQLRRSI